MQSVIAINKIEHALVVSIQVDLTLNLLNSFRSELLGKVRNNVVKGVLLDMSGVKTFGREEMTELVNIAHMVNVMGKKCIFVGLRPGVVMGLLDIEFNVEEINSEANLERGLQRLLD
ncbi:STAS domain-containing protein [Vibrio sp. T187]|uniref:STAS domain-containing protein n=1 Tax=Vibrio TaxID=662 RepID=UPI0010C9DE7E|nr:MULTISPECIES: STAS domain-containing protein [Vibrio]MBW3695022.1 STAS domain-containing protein [Vibrio sp. T187]